MPSVELFKKEGNASTFVDAAIEDDGRVQVIRNSFGPGDYETEVTAAVAKEDRDRLLLALLARARDEETGLPPDDQRDALVLSLLKQLYDGNINALEGFRSLAESKGIPVDYFRWP